MHDLAPKVEAAYRARWVLEKRLGSWGSVAVAATFGLALPFAMAFLAPGAEKGAAVALALSLWLHLAIAMRAGANGAYPGSSSVGLAWIRWRYGVPARAWMRVRYDGPKGAFDGVIHGASGGCLIVNFEGEDKGLPSLVHPTDRLTYFGADGAPWRPHE